MGSASLRGDILPPDHKSIQHTVRFANANGVTDFVLYIFPRDLSRGQPGNSSVRVPTNGVVAISGLNPLAIAEAKGIYLVAIPNSLHGPPDRSPEETWFTGETKGVLKCQLSTTQTRSLPKSDSRDKVEEAFEIRGLPEKLGVVRIETKGGAAISDSRRIDRRTAAILAGVAALATAALVLRSRTLSRAER